MIGCTPFKFHVNAKYKYTEFSKRVLQHFIKYREGLVKKDKHIDFRVGKKVGIITCKKSNMKHAAKRHFLDKKWGAAKIVGILSTNKIKVWYLGEGKLANRWEVCRVNRVKGLA
jgi:hypothetical protein